jgi:thiol-disulfide isomerase/thioredoxin
MAKSKDKKVKEEVKENSPTQSTLYYFYTVGCGFCKKAEPIVDELIKEGHDILKLDLAEKDNQGLKKELHDKYGKQCGTPWFIDAETGNQLCGYREKNIIEKWVNGEDIPAPPRPNSPPPKIPFMKAPESEVNQWKKDYDKWCVDNQHVPNLPSVDELLSRPRPNTQPPTAPQPNATDEQIEEWGAKYEEWAKDNTHLPNLQPAKTIVNRLKQQRDQRNNPQPVNSVPSNPDLEARFQRIEQKMDKLIKHLGVK